MCPKGFKDQHFRKGDSALLLVCRLVPHKVLILECVGQLCICTLLDALEQSQEIERLSVLVLDVDPKFGSILWMRLDDLIEGLHCLFHLALVLLRP